MAILIANAIIHLLPWAAGGFGQVGMFGLIADLFCPNGARNRQLRLRVVDAHTDIATRLNDEAPISIQSALADGKERRIVALYLDSPWTIGVSPSSLKTSRASPVSVVEIRSVCRCHANADVTVVVRSQVRDGHCLARPSWRAELLLHHHRFLPVRDPRKHPHVRFVIRVSYEPFSLAWDALHIHTKTSMVCVVIGLKKDTGIHPAIAGT